MPSPTRWGTNPELLQVVIEVDCGARRSGAPAEAAGELALAARNRGLVPAGVFTYPGHGSAGPDARKRAAEDQDAALITAVRSLSAVGITAEVVSAGSTPTVEFATNSVITEIRPGEYVFNDLNNTRLGACTEDQIALFVAGTVVSDWVPDQVILDIGTKALGREGSPEIGYGAIAGTTAVLSKLNEYHGFLPLPAGFRPERRDRAPGGAQPRLPRRRELRGIHRHRQHRHNPGTLACRRPRIPQLTENTGPNDRGTGRRPPAATQQQTHNGVTDMRLDKTTALVTGANSGIGQAVCSHFRNEGARLLLTGRREHLDSAQPEDLYVPGDLNDEAFVESLARQAAESFGTVDIVVLNHGLQVSGPLTEMAYEDAKNVLHSNLLSAFLVMKHFAPLMPATGGSFVLVSSRLGMVGKPDEVLYSAAKGGLIMLAKGAAIEWASRNIRVNVVAPGLTATPIIEASFQRREDPEAYRAQREGQIPLQRLATPEEIADAILFMASPESSYITGAVLPVDGGYTAA